MLRLASCMTLEETFAKHARGTKSVVALRLGRTQVNVGLDAEKLRSLNASYVNRGIFNNEQLAEWVLRGIDPVAEAERARVDVLELAAYYQLAMDSVEPRILERIEQEIARGGGLGELDKRSKDYERERKQLGLDKIAKVKPAELADWLERFKFPWLIPKGPIRAVDLRPFLGDARNQGGRGTCTAFGSTVVTEALEFLRDRRPGPRDLAEQLVFWYSKGGQLNTAGGYSCAAALRHQAEYGAVEEFYAPYNTKQFDGNHAQVPISDQAMDRAQFYRNGEVVELEPRDVNAVKAALRSGRCVGIIHDATDWNTATGTYTFPDPLDSKGIGGNHCTAIIGFIDRDDLPATFEGGYFIQRNSWGGANSPTNVLGPEYGGHLLMPYGWYRRYTHSAYTVRDKGGPGDDQRNWLVEYFANENLQGAPLQRGTIDFAFLQIPVNLPKQVPQVAFDWGGGSPVAVNFLGLALDALPKNHFSIRFSKLQRFRNGWYEFKLSGDDGVRLWIDDRLVINGWKAQAKTQYSASCYLTGGDHVMRIEYYERTGAASVSLEVHPREFSYELFANDTLTGPAKASFNDTATDLEWRHAPPVSSPLQGVFSLTGTGRLAFEPGLYRFHALHTGGCRIYLDGALVFDHWDPALPAAMPDTAVGGGLHTVRVEYKHSERVPAPGVNGYYRAALNFGWEQREWHARYYRDPEREAFDAAPAVADRDYVSARVLSLTGAPAWTTRYAAVHAVGGEYSASEGAATRLMLPNAESFTAGFVGAPDLTGDYLSAWLTRQVFIQQPGYYQVKLSGGDLSRLVINGKQALDDHVVGKPHDFADVYLPAGMVDIGVELGITRWGKSLDFELRRVAWQVNYYEDTELTTPAGSAQVDSVGAAIAARPASVGDSVYSLRATRTLQLPVGKYRFQVRTDDAVRLKLGGLVKLDAWINQTATAYSVEYEHTGGNLTIEVEYYQSYGGAALELEMKPIGYFAEYYRGTVLNQASGGLDRTAPIAYRYDDAVEFEWGAGNRLDRIGSDRFSARWRGKIHLPVGRWEAQLTTDDGARLYLDGRLLIDQWRSQPPTTYLKQIDLTDRHHEVLVEYFENTGNATCSLAFKRLV